MRQRPAPPSRYPSPAAQRRTAELWKARLGLGAATIITVLSLVVMYRIAGVSVEAMLTVSQNTLTTVQVLSSGLGLPLPEFLTTLEISPAPTGDSPAAGQPPADATTAQPTQAPAPTAAVVVANTPVASSTVAPTPAPEATATVAPGSVREHTVVAGDTLFALARRYESSVQAIVAANNLRDSNVTLQIGQRLIVP